MSNTLQERMFEACNCSIAGTYTIFKGLSGKLARIAEIYALEQQYKILSESQDYLPKKSNHKIAEFIDKKMEEILSKIQEAKS